MVRTEGGLAKVAASGDTEAGRAPSGMGRSAVVLAAATAGIVLAPYLTTTLGHRQALVAQAAAILLCTAGAAAAALGCPGRRGRLFAAPLALRAGVVLYAATAALAAAVGVLRGNETSLVAGQLLSMGLLPLGFVAAASHPSPRRTAAFAWALSAAAGVAALVHFAHWGVTLRRGQQLLRLYMGNSVSLAGVSLLAFLLALGLAAGSRGRARRWAAGLAGLVALFIVGSGTRSLWVATLLGLALLAWLARAWRFLAHPRRWRALALAVACLAAAAAGVALWWRWPRVNLLPDADTMAPPFWRYPRGAGVAIVELPGGPRTAVWWQGERPDRLFALSHPIGLPGRRLYRLRGLVRTDGTGLARLGVAVLPGRRPVCAWHVPVLPAGSSWREVQLSFALDGDHSVYVVAGANAGASGTFFVTDLRLEELGGASLGPASRQLEYLGGRLRTTVDVVEKGPAKGDENVTFRLWESLAVWQEFTTSSPAAMLFGHGLGARYRFGVWGWSDTGQRVFVDQPNYIHNFYAFLLFKTGVVGAAAVLAALGCWLAALHRAARTAAEALPRHLARAACAALAAYAVWSLVCPEILDFRVAPLWGFVLGTLAGPSRVPAEAGNAGCGARSVT